MAFTSFSSLDDVLRRYSIRQVRGEFVSGAEHPAAGGNYLDELRLTLTEVPFSRSEGFVCEALIYPTLREVWKHYRANLSLFSHETVEADEELRGELDYV